MEKKWCGTWPANCEMHKLAEGTDLPLSTCSYFVDGRTAYGYWALMCPVCHAEHGTGFGIGSGQKYDSKTLVKIGD